MGQSNTINVSAIDSFAIGYGNTVNGERAAAIGLSNTVGGNYSFAFGDSCATTVGQPYTFAGGRASEAQAQYGFAFGNNAIAYGAHAIALAQGARAGGARSFAWGYNCVASQDGSMILACGDGNAGRNTAPNQYGAYFAGGFAFGMYNADYAALTDFVKIDTSGNLINKAGVADQSYSRQVPTNGFSITIGKYVKTLVIVPASPLATGTIIMPAAPIDGQIIDVACEAAGVADLTVNPNTGQSIGNAPKSIYPGGGFRYQYDLANTNWMPIFQSLGDVDYFDSIVLDSSPVSLSTGVTSNITSIVLTPGTWHVTGAVGFIITGNCTQINGGSSAVSANLPSTARRLLQKYASPTINATNVGAIPSRVVAVASGTTTTLYLVAQTTFTTGTVDAFGELIAYRIKNS
jgi:hypothetical protein